MVIRADPPFESHPILTEDGYHLTLFKIPASPTAPTPRGRKGPVLIVHGLISQGSHWFMNHSQKDLPSKLSGEGYDVWIANLRGTPFSRSHSQITPDSSLFWDFSWHEMALYDVPAMILYILAESQAPALSYVGHSMGCAVFFAALALRPELNLKVSLMIALAPSVYGKHIRNMLARLSVPVGTLLGSLPLVYSREIFPMSLIAYAKRFLPFLTLNPERVGSWILQHFGRRTGVMGSNQIERSRMIHIAWEIPSPTSLKTFCHGTQCFSAGKFQQYDYGKIGNFERYGEPTPPAYDLSRVTVPVATFSSIGDQLCTLNDVKMLASQLPNLVGNYSIQHNQFAHTDFMFGKDADRLVYDRILYIFKQHLSS